MPKAPKIQSGAAASRGCAKLLITILINMSRKPSGITAPTPLKCFPDFSRDKKSSGIKPPTHVCVPRSSLTQKPVAQDLQKEVYPEKAKTDSVYSIQSTQEPLPTKSLYKNSLPPVDQVKDLESSSTISTNELIKDNESLNKTFTLQTSDQVLLVEKDIQIEETHQEYSYEFVEKSSQFQRPFSHTASYCVNLLEPHSDWLRHER